jgi:hypothetical protein
MVVTSAVKGQSTNVGWGIWEKKSCKLLFAACWPGVVVDALVGAMKDNPSKKRMRFMVVPLVRRLKGMFEGTGVLVDEE